MTQYIDKAVVVTEIERRINENKKDIQHATHKHLEEYFEGYEDALVLFKEKFLNTLEVKEMNLENSMICKVDWYDGFLLDYTQEQQDELLEKIDANVGDKIRVILMKE